MSVLEGFRVTQIGPGLAAAVCGRLLMDVGASVSRIDPNRSSPLAEYFNPETAADHTIETADLIVCEGSPATLRRTNRDPEALRRLNPTAAVVLISPFGQTGPRAEEPATDLSLFFASGIARMLAGQVDDLDEPPMRPVGEQSAFIGGLAAACAGMHAALLRNGAVIDVSIHEALATLAITELAKAGQTGKSWSRQLLADGNGATVCILPVSDGFVAISPREDRQWASWLRVMGSPAWGTDPRFAGKKDRVANWDILHALMSDWSRGKSKQWIAATAQAEHVPSFALCEPAEHLLSPQLKHRGFFKSVRVQEKTVLMPGSPFGLQVTRIDSSFPVPGRSASADTPCASGARSDGDLPLSGIRVLDFSWVIAGPTGTRYLAAMGAEVIKIEAPGRGDPGRTSELHTVLGQAKRGIVLDLKHADAIVIAKALAAKSDVLVENFATGVMDRLGLGADAMRAVNPNLIYVSASGLGRTGPEAYAVAYGTLLQCYAGFAGLNRHPGKPPRVGMAWLDPMCGLMLAFITAASLFARRSGAVARIDFSMIEAMLWTMAGPLLSHQLAMAAHPADPMCVQRGTGSDDWVAAGSLRQPAANTAQRSAQRDRSATALARSADLVASPHLRARGFWQDYGAGVLPGLPWRASFGRDTGRAPELGADTDAVLRQVLGMPANKIKDLRDAGAIS